MFIGTKARKSPVDRAIILPAVVLVVQSIPWFTARFRLRMLVPFMLAYVVISVWRCRWKAAPYLERRVTVRLLVSFVLFFSAYMVADTLCYREFNNTYFVPQVFGLFYIWLFHSLISENKIREIKILTLVSIGAMLIASLMGVTYLGDELNRDIIRDMTGGGVDDIDAAHANLSGIGNFGFVYSLGLLVPAMAYAAICVKKLSIRVLFWISALAFFLYAYRSGFTILMVTVLAGFVFFSGACFFPKYSYYKWVLWLCVVLLISATLYPSFGNIVVSPLESLGYLTDNKNYLERLESIVDAIQGTSVDAYALDRTDRYWMSWKVFLRHPFFGADLEAAAFMGGHSFVFDFLAKGGVFSFSFLIIFIFNYTKYLKVIVYPCSKYAQFLVEIYFLMVTIVCILNPLCSAIVYCCLFFMLPGMSLFFKDSAKDRRFRPVRIGPNAEVSM